MRRRIACLFMCLLFPHVSAVRAEAIHETSLLARSGWARFRLVLGRIEVANIHSSQTRTATSGGDDVDLFEKLTISGDTDIPTVRYERVTATDTVLLAVIDGNRVEIDRSNSELPPAMTTSQGVPVSFRQQPDTEVVLCVGAESDLRVFRAPTLWHLIVRWPDACTTHLVPLLKLMQPGWHIEAMLARATDELIREAEASDFELRHAARRLIVKLGAEDFAIRQQAQRELGQLGIGILPYLGQVSPAELSGEQRRRVAQVGAELRAKQADSPERLALWLVEDERIWLSMLEHDELPIRTIAANHLAKRFAKPMAYDPAGTPLERTQQIARIRTRIERR